MLENPNRVLSHDELTSTVWKSSVISRSTLNAAVCAVRHAIGDTGSKQQYIKTVSGCGYRFIAAFLIIVMHTQKHVLHCSCRIEEGMMNGWRKEQAPQR